MIIITHTYTIEVKLLFSGYYWTLWETWSSFREAREFATWL